MASYSIVLNISGNATTRAEKLAAALARADVSAKSLAMSLRAVGAAAHTFPVRTIRVSSAAPRAASVAPGREGLTGTVSVLGGSAHVSRP